MRTAALFLLPALLAAGLFVPVSDAAPPCPPDACCKGPLRCLEDAVQRWLDELVLSNTCVYSDDRIICVETDPRATCRVHEFDGTAWRCVL